MWDVSYADGGANLTGIPVDPIQAIWVREAVVLVEYCTQDLVACSDSMKDSRREHDLR